LGGIVSSLKKPSWDYGRFTCSFEGWLCSSASDVVGHGQEGERVFLFDGNDFVMVS
jgi:hypothetical protein